MKLYVSSNNFYLQHNTIYIGTFWYINIKKNLLVKFDTLSIKSYLIKLITGVWPFKRQHEIMKLNNISTRARRQKLKFNEKTFSSQLGF